jgi:fucose 4-O-acetylase-like acetyltransferase
VWRCEALDWMKAVGISLIVYGHVAHATTVPWTPPVYVKQFGVAFFLFATGMTLARERRRPIETVVARLFPVYLFGLATAFTITAAGLLFGRGLELSNFFPFLGGANVLFNNFPANPTTWYLGTYVHVLLLWALLLSRHRFGMGAVIAAVVLEVPIRAALITWAGPFIAYMAFTNWMAVFIAGLAYGARPATAPGPRWISFALLAAGLGLSMFAFRSIGPRPEFPFMTIDGAPFAGTLAVSIATSALYLWTTLLTFKALDGLAAPRLVMFLSRNSLLVVLIHMPVFLFLNPILARAGWSYGARVALEFVLCLPVLAIVSEAVLALVRPRRLAERVMAIVLPAAPPNRAFAAPHAASLEPR